MSAAQISDLELDGLLSEVPTPPPPAANLVDRIAEQALRTPQERRRRFATFRRHGPRRRGTLWTAVVAANLMAAAAAAASWDGHAFDFRRLTELPRRVAVAIHSGHHRPAKQLVALRRARRAAPAPVAVRAAAQAPVEPASVTPVREPVAVTAIPRTPKRQRFLDGTVERPRWSEPSEFRVHHTKLSHPSQQRLALVHQKIAHERPVERLERTTSPPPPPSQESTFDLVRGHERTERSAAPERRQAAPEPERPVPSGSDSASPQADTKILDNRQLDVRRRRLGWWPKQMLQRERPRERRNLFRRRF